MVVHRAFAPAAVGAGLVAGTIAVAVGDPARAGWMPPCPVHSLTGLWCPGCGMTRATHHLFRGDLGAALHHHAFVVLVLAGIAGVWATWFLAAIGRPLPWRRLPLAVRTGGPMIALVVLLAFTVVRNLPWVDGLRG